MAKKCEGERMTKRFKIGLDLITIEDTSKEYGALNQDEVVDELNRLNDENERIKQTIKDMRNTERTEIGKMTLRQLWRQIQ